MSKSPCISSRLGLIVLILGTSQISHSQSDVPTEILDGWRASYERSVEDFVEDMLEAFRNEASIPESSIDAVLVEVDEFLRTELSWDKRGKYVASNALIANCGASLLEKLTPYFNQSKDWDSADEKMRSDYASCSIEVDFELSTSVPGLLMERDQVNRLEKILRRHEPQPHK